MLKITAINVQEKKKDRCNIFVDGEFYVALSLEIVMNYRLKAGQEIDKKALDDIVFEGQKSDALKLAINYVSKALKTKKQVSISIGIKASFANPINKREIGFKIIRNERITHKSKLFIKLINPLQKVAGSNFPLWI